jgi:hypothetical protein
MDRELSASIGSVPQKNLAREGGCAASATNVFKQRSSKAFAAQRSRSIGIRVTPPRHPIAIPGGGSDTRIDTNRLLTDNDRWWRKVVDFLGKSAILELKIAYFWTDSDPRLGVLPPNSSESARDRQSPAAVFKRSARSSSTGVFRAARALWSPDSGAAGALLTNGGT